MRLPQSAVDSFAILFGAGVGIETATGISLQSLLCDHLAIDGNYVDQRIQTIFLNGRAVDRIDQVMIKANDVIALSAAMPGLAGATLRKGGFFAPLRKDISHQDTPVALATHQKATVTLKLFNLVARELGPHLLHRGVWIKGKDLEKHLRQFDVAAGCCGPSEAIYNDVRLSAEHLAQLDFPDHWMFLQVNALG